MDRLWAPWRMDYIRANGDDGRCVLCVGERADEDRRRLVLQRGEHAYVMMNRYPYSNGHLMIAPYRHLASPDDLRDDEVLEMHRLLVRCRRVLQECLAPQGFNVGLNLGRAAGAGIADHLHLHVVPRWSGDTNFMTVLGEVRVIPEHLEATYAELARAFAAGT